MKMLLFVLPKDHRDNVSGAARSCILCGIVEGQFDAQLSYDFIPRKLLVTPLRTKVIENKTASALSGRQFIYSI